jgi:hypothetical protein
VQADAEEHGGRAEGVDVVQAGGGHSRTLPVGWDGECTTPNQWKFQPSIQSPGVDSWPSTSPVASQQNTPQFTAQATLTLIRAARSGYSHNAILAVESFEFSPKDRADFVMLNDDFDFLTGGDFPVKRDGFAHRDVVGCENVGKVDATVSR